MHWAEPRDIPFDETNFKINDPRKPSIGSTHADGAHILLSDGSVEFIPATVSPEQLRELLIANAIRVGPPEGGAEPERPAKRRSPASSTKP